MDRSETSASAAAELVLKERERQKIQHKEQVLNTNHQGSDHVQLEEVSVPKWQSPRDAQIDESELDKRQRALSQKLEQKQIEVQLQGRKLAKVRQELKALEQPIKAEIMNIRQSLEDANRREISLVDTVNALRKDLVQKERSLKEVRDEKQSLADSLIRVMADYEKRKTERLNEIAELIGGEPVQQDASKSTFAGF